jgi:hypothetical protein
MDPRKLKLMLLPYSGFMAPSEDDGDDLGGDVLDLEKDEPKDEPEDRGDSLNTDEPKEEVKPEPKAEEKKAEPETPEPKQSAHIPKSRFDEVIAERNAERERSAELERRIQALEASSKPREAEAPKVEAKDVDALELEYANLMLEGDVEKAVKLRGQINAEIRRQAEEAADQRAAQREAAQTQKAITNELQATANQIEKDYPYLSTEDGEMVVPQITALRDAYIAKGMKPAEALRKAADFIAPRFDPEPKQESKDDEKPEPKQDTRAAAAIARGIKDSAAQPPQMSGVGNRSMDTVKRDVTRMSEDEFDSLPESEKRKMRGD